MVYPKLLNINYFSDTVICCDIVFSINVLNSFHLFLKESVMPRLGELSAEKGADTDQRVLAAYQKQCVAEAQEG